MSDIRISKMFYLHLFLVTFSLFPHLMGNIHFLFFELPNEPCALPST